ncbi:hypothetical protein TCAL_03239 [Tigriopus californicus]|uniref:C2H2-type domain-containing protein n=1 Tax=Tigriopus californicus TaxID=6832 RepID=A0A553NV60_TIGCA|nr:zinc finger protein GLI2-like [Tigriopus californicus]TRY69321.1 hypothetical protein TCAL_03239 [Tigriopus californicus]
MLDKNGFPLQFPASAFAAFPGLAPGMPGDPRAHVWQHPMTATTTQPNNTSQSNGNQGFAPPINSIESSAMLGLPPNAHSISPNYLNALHHSPTASLRLSAAAAVSGHQEYLNAAAQRLGELQASAGLVDPLHFDASRFAAASRVTRKRALSASPYSEMDLANLIRNSPLNGSASSSGSYGHLSPGTMSPALGFHAANAHLQQLQAHLLRSASSPYLPTSSFLHSSAAALHSPYFPLFTSASSVPTTTTTTSSPSNALANPKMTPEHSSNVVSSTMEDDDSSDTSPRERIKGSKTSSLRVPPSNASTGDKDDVKEEPDFVETHCHWRGCDQEFGTQDDLVKHLNNDHIGTNKKLFICQWQTCSRAEKPFKAQYMLVVHMRRHTGEKPHRCTFESCSKAYSRLENLKTHLRSHTGEKPYVCEFPGCAKAFSNASDRAKHQNRTHSNEKPYACKALGCTKRYTDPSSLRKHVKTVHGADFYASKRHKGESHEDGSSHNPDGDSSGKSRAKHSNQATGQSGIKLENSPLSLSPADVRLPNSNPISHD